MAHEIAIIDGVASMAYTNNDTPWHGLGQNVDPNASIEEWQKAAGLDFKYDRSPVSFQNGIVMNDGVVTPKFYAFEDKHVLYRSDTLQPMSVVSSRYKTVQPDEVLEFFRDLVDTGGFKINTAGALREGKKIWALAEIGESAKIVSDDKVDGYLLLATSCDGSLPTTVQFTSVRVVCANTLAMSLDNKKNTIKIPHNTHFIPQSVKQALGIAHNNFEEFIYRTRQLAEKEVNQQTAENFLKKLLKEDEEKVKMSRGYNTILDLFNGAGKGAKMDGVKGTAWGLLNAVTEYYDHHKPTRTNDARLDAAWFGLSADVKNEAFNLAMSI